MGAMTRFGLKRQDGAVAMADADVFGAFYRFSDNLFAFGYCFRKRVAKGKECGDGRR